MDKKSLIIVCFLELGFVLVSFLLNVGLGARILPVSASVLAVKRFGLWFLLWPLATAILAGHRIAARREDQALIVTVAVLAAAVFIILVMTQEKHAGTI
jgi:hypothetical protein